MVDMVDKNIEIDIPMEVRVLVDRAAIRLGDSEEYEAVGTLRKDEVVSVAAVSAETGWYAVRVPRYILWIDNTVCEAIKNEESDEAGEA